MTSPTEKGPQPEYLYTQMNEKSTEELLDIWQTADREIWTDEALQVVETILRRRLGALPARRPPAPAEPLEELSDERDERLLRVADWCNTGSWVILMAGVISVLVQLFARFYYSLQSNTALITGGYDILNMLIFLLNQFGGLLGSAFWFLVLQAISEMIYLMSDIRQLVLPENPEEAPEA